MGEQFKRSWFPFLICLCLLFVTLPELLISVESDSIYDRVERGQELQQPFYSTSVSADCGSGQWMMLRPVYDVGCTAGSWGSVPSVGSGLLILFAIGVVAVKDKTAETTELIRSLDRKTIRLGVMKGTAITAFTAVCRRLYGMEDTMMVIGASGILTVVQMIYKDMHEKPVTLQGTANDFTENLIIGILGKLLLNEVKL